MSIDSPKVLIVEGTSRLDPNKIASNSITISPLTNIQSGNNTVRFYIQ